ncbi:MAG: hypothetical protein GEV11_01515 [Streptosporangiales bacterium]|nr:hypothetical protein [Streptosporangiales bacterium]
MLGESRTVRLVRTGLEVDRLLVRSAEAVKRAERAGNRGDVQAARQAFVDASYVLDEVDRRRVGGDSGDAGPGDATGMPGDDAALDHAWKSALANYERAGEAMLRARHPRLRSVPRDTA